MPRSIIIAITIGTVSSSNASISLKSGASIDSSVYFFKCLNRFFIKSSLTDVIFQKNQYSTVKDGKIYKRETEVTPEMIKEVTKNAVQRALKGEDPTEELLKEKAYSLGLDVEKYVENGATFFYSPRWSSTQAMAARANIKVKVQYGEHIYYTYWDR